MTEKPFIAHTGRTFPASAPKSVPRLQPGSAAHMAPIKYQTLSKPSCAIAMPKTSSVTSKPMSIRTPSGVSGESFWLSAQLISMYRALMMSVMRIIIHTPAFSVMTVMPPYSPAEALLKRLIRKPCKAVIPAAWQEMPMPKLTAR